MAMRKKIKAKTTRAEPIHDREDCETDVATRSCNAVDQQQVSRLHLDPLSISFRASRDNFHFRTAPTDVQKIDFDQKTVSAGKLRKRHPKKGRMPLCGSLPLPYGFRALPGGDNPERIF
jgi:hypothetical protein